MHRRETKTFAFTLTAVIYGGRNKVTSFGFFDEKDSFFQDALAVLAGCATPELHRPALVTTEFVT